MDEIPFNCHEIEIFMKLGVVFRFLGFIALLVMLFVPTKFLDFSKMLPNYFDWFPYSSYKYQYLFDCATDFSCKSSWLLECSPNFSLT